MSKALETAAAADFGMVRDDDNQVITVKSAALDATDKTKVKLTVYSSLTDAKTYTVTYTASDAAKTQSTAKVTVTDGTVADVAITPVEITANQETEIRYQTLDANGVVVSERLATSPTSNVSVTWDSLLGTMNEANSKYILYNVSDTAKFTVTYHTYKYDTTTGAEVGVITKDFTVTAVKDASVISQYAYTVATEKPYSWSKVTPKQTVALEDTDRNAYFLIKDSKGADVTDTCNYTVESSDNSIVVADGDVKETWLRPVAKGSAYLMIKDTDGKVVHTLPITVGDKRALSTFKLSASSVNVVSGASTASPAVCGYTDVIAKDQYGEDIKVTLDIKNTTTPGDNGTVDDTAFNSGKNYLVVTGRHEEKSEVYTITATAGNKSMPTTLRVKTSKVNGNDFTYSVVFVKDGKAVSEIDTTVSESKSAAAPTSQAVQAYIVRKQGSVVVDELKTGDVTGMRITKNDGTVVAKIASGDAAKPTSGTAIISNAAITSGTVLGVVTSASAYNTTPAAVSATAVDGSSCVTKNLGVGTYTVVFDLKGADTRYADRTHRASASFTVKDTQTAVTAKVKETNFGDLGGGDIKEKLQSGDEKFIEYYFGDKKTTVSNVIAAKATFTNGKKNVFVTNVTVKVKVADTSYDMNVVVPINKTFITTNGEWSND